MFEELKDYMRAITECQNRTSDLRKRFEEDYERWRLTPFTMGEKDEYDLFTSNRPRALSNKIDAMLGTAGYRVTITPKEDTREARDKANVAERAIYGMFNLINSRLRASRQPSLQEQLAWYIDQRGWVGLRAYIDSKENKEGKREAVFRVSVCDPLRVYWDEGEDGLLWYASKRMATKGNLKAEYDMDIKENSKAIYDFWSDEVNAIFTGSEFLKKATPHGLGHMPCILLMTGGVPQIQSDKFSDTIKDAGESLYGALRQPQDARNKMMTYYMTLIGQGVHAPMGVWSEGGKKGFGGKSPWRKGAEMKFDSSKEEDARPLLTPTVPRDALALLSMIERDDSMGGLSPISYGEAGGLNVGYGIHLLTMETDTFMMPRKVTIDAALSWLARELLCQYAEGGFSKLTLLGRDKSNEEFQIDLASEDIEGDWFPEVEILPRTPRDEAGDMVNAQIAVTNKLLSRKTARERFAHVQDSSREEDRILQEEADQLPSIKLFEMARAYEAGGRPDLRDLVLNAIAQMGSAGFMPSGMPSKRQGEAVEPQYAQGVPRKVYPSEEMGKTQGEVF